MTGSRPNAVSRAKSAAGARWSRAKGAHPGLAHVVAAWARFQQHNGSQYAAAITYFSFLALFPLLLLAVAVAGFVLSSHPAALHSLFDNITTKVPGTLGTTLRGSVQTAIDKRAGVGIVGLLGVLLAGLGWIGNLRTAIDAAWGSRPAKRNFVTAKVANLLVLAGLGIGVLVSVGLTAVGTSLTDQILRGLGLSGVAGLRYLVKVLGILLAVCGDMVIFSWLLVRLPVVQVPRAVAVKGALLASVGFEVLKVVGTYTIAKSAGSPTLGPFAGLLAVLIWIQLVARYMLFCAAWMAVLTAEAAEPGAAVAARVSADVVADHASDGSSDDRPSDDRVAISPAALAGSLLGVGAAAGAAATAWATRRRGQD